MELERADRAREMKLEGWTLILTGGILIALLVGSFYLGRWVERGTAPAGSTEASRATQDGGAAGLEEASEEVSFFDTLSGSEKAVEPRRESAPPSAAAGTDARESRQPPAGSAGPWYVQVFAGRDKETADVLIRSLSQKGHSVRLDTRREGSGALYRVQVGGFATREAADSAADRLRREGQAGAWVTRVR
jgi:cell division protein FtsN